MVDRMIPEDLKYTEAHEWVQLVSPGVVRFGITHFAQDSLGDIVFVSLPEEGTAVAQGDACGEVESTKSVADVYAPLAGTVTARNDVVETSPEAINEEPYGNGWLIELSIEDDSVLDALLDAAAYKAHTEG